jgi:hypothetical protein
MFAYAGGACPATRTVNIACHLLLLKLALRCNDNANGGLHWTMKMVIMINAHES